MLSFPNNNLSFSATNAAFATVHQPTNLTASLFIETTLCVGNKKHKPLNRSRESCLASETGEGSEEQKKATRTRMRNCLKFASAFSSRIVAATRDLIVN